MNHPSSSNLRRNRAALLLLAIAAVILAAGTANRWSRADQLRQSAESQVVPTVGLISPVTLDNESLELPARIEAWASAPIHARVNGYLKRWTHDIGAPVKAGEVLAEIDTPELDQELLQARAELTRAQSEASIAETTAKRWQALLTSEVVSRQSVEERTADSEARRAVVGALQANVRRIQTMQQFKQLVSPFDGVITARSTDVGSLIGGGIAASPEMALFVVSDIRRLRVYVNVPQRQLASLSVGTKAQLTVPELPGEVFDVTVQSLSQAIDLSTGTMRVQLIAENADRKLLPGAFAKVNFAGSANTKTLALPPSALIIGRSGVQVAILDAQGRVRLRQVTITRDLGRMVALSGGVEPGDRVVNSPPDGLANGDQVKVAALTTPTAKERNSLPQ